MLHGGVPSFVLRWLGAMLPSSLGGPLRLPRRPPPPIPMPASGECSVTFIGHATALVRYARARLLTDPMFASSLYTLRRLRPAALPDGALESIDVVLHLARARRSSAPRVARAARPARVDASSSPPACVCRRSAFAT